MNIFNKYNLTIGGGGGGGGGGGFSATPPAPPLQPIPPNLTLSDFSFIKIKNALMLLAGVTEEYIKSQDDWWIKDSGGNKIKLTLDAAEFLIKTFLIKNDFTANFGFFYNENTFSDKATSSALEKVLSTFENGRLTNGYSVYSLSKKSISSSPYVSTTSATATFYSSFSSPEKTNYDFNYVYAFDRTKTVVADNNEYIIEYNIYNNNILNNSVQASTATFTSTALANATQMITAGTRLPAVVTVKIETGYESEGSCQFTADGEYYCYKYDIFGISNGNAMVDLGRKCYDFVHVDRTCNVLGTQTKSLPAIHTEYFCSDLYLIYSYYQKTGIGHPVVNSGFYLMPSKDFVMFGCGTSRTGSPYSQLSSDFWFNYDHGYCYIDRGGNCGLCSFVCLDNCLKSYCLTLSCKDKLFPYFNDVRIHDPSFYTGQTPLTGIFPSGVKIFSFFNDGIREWDSNVSNFSFSGNNAATGNFLNSDNHGIQIVRWNYSGYQNVPINSNSIAKYTYTGYYLNAYYDFCKPFLKDYLCAGGANKDVYFYLNINGEVCDIKNNFTYINYDPPVIGADIFGTLSNTSSNRNVYVNHVAGWHFKNPIALYIGRSGYVPPTIQEEDGLRAIFTNCNSILCYCSQNGSYWNKYEDFTIEMWVKPCCVGATQTWFSTAEVDPQTTAKCGIYFGVSASNAYCLKMFNDVNAVLVNCNSSTTHDVNFNQWQHVALVRCSSAPNKSSDTAATFSSCYLFFKNGNIVYSCNKTTTDSIFGGSGIILGARCITATNYEFSCTCMVGVKISNCAKYTDVFSLPTYLPSDEACTNLLLNFGSSYSPNAIRPIQEDILLRFSKTPITHALSNSYTKKTIYKDLVKSCVISQAREINCELYKNNFIDGNTVLNLNSIFGGCGYVDLTSYGLGFDFYSSNDGVCKYGLFSSSLNSCLSYNSNLKIFDGVPATTTTNLAGASLFLRLWLIAAGLPNNLVQPNSVCCINYIQTLNKGNYYSDIANTNISSSDYYNLIAKFYLLNMDGVCHIIFAKTTAENNYHELQNIDIKSLQPDKLYNYPAQGNMASYIARDWSQPATLNPNTFSGAFLTIPFSGICYTGISAATCQNTFMLFENCLAQASCIYPNTHFTNYNINPVCQGVCTCTITFSWYTPIGIRGSSAGTKSKTYKLCYKYYEIPLSNKNTCFQLYNTINNDIILLPNAKYDTNGKPLRRYVKVTKMSHESLSALISKEVTLQKITEIIPQKFSYPFSALVGTKIDSRAFSQIPNRTFDCKLKKILVPSNYFPMDRSGIDIRYLTVANGDEVNLDASQRNSARTAYKIYNGDWDGSFKMAWTNNPAWILMDMLVNKRYGLGNYIESNQVDIWELYKIARWCDNVDDEGYYFGVKDSYGGVEPRHTFNGVIQDKFNIFDMINQIASTFRGNVYYMNSLITFDCDRLKPAVGEFNNSDVKDGLFTYTNHKKDEEYTAIDVTYVDAKDNFKPKLEYVEDSNGIRQRGVLKKQINAFGTTSRGQAIRTAQHFLFQTSKENCNVNFVTDIRALLYKPGDLVAINDELYNSTKNFGSIKYVEDFSKDEIKIVIDKILDTGIYNDKEISLYMPQTKPKYDDYCYKLQSYPTGFLLEMNRAQVLLCEVPYNYTTNFVTERSPDQYKLLILNNDCINNAYLYIKNNLAMQFNKFDENNVATYSGCIDFCYYKVCMTGVGTYPDLTYKLCGPLNPKGVQAFINNALNYYKLCTLNFNFSYLPNSDVNNNYSQYGVWCLSFQQNLNYYLFDTSNLEFKIQSPHSKYFWNYFDCMSYYRHTGSDNFGPLYSKCTARINTAYLTLGNVYGSFMLAKGTTFSALYAKNNTTLQYIKSIFCIRDISYSTPKISYSDIIQSDYPNIDTFYINCYYTGTSYCCDQIYNQYTEIYLSKYSKLIDHESENTFGNIKPFVDTFGTITNTTDGIPSSCGLKIMNGGSMRGFLQNFNPSTQYISVDSVFFLNPAVLNAIPVIKTWSPAEAVRFLPNAAIYFKSVNSTDIKLKNAIQSIINTGLNEYTIFDGSNFLNQVENQVILSRDSQGNVTSTYILPDAVASSNILFVGYNIHNKNPDIGTVAQTVSVGSPYSIKLSNQNQKLFKISSINENYINEYNIIATYYNPEKFKEIDESTNVDRMENTFNYLNALNSTNKNNTADKLLAPAITSIEIVQDSTGNKFIVFKWPKVSVSNTAAVDSNYVYYNIYIQTPSKQTANSIATIQNKDVDPTEGVFVYRYLLGKSNYELGTYKISIQTWTPVLQYPMVTLDSMYKYSAMSSRAISVINY